MTEENYYELVMSGHLNSVLDDMIAKNFTVDDAISHFSQPIYPTLAPSGIRYIQQYFEGK